MISPSLRSLQLNTRLALVQSPNKTVFANGYLKLQRVWKNSMSVTVDDRRPAIKDGILRINGKATLTGVPENVITTPVADSSVFLGANSPESRSRHVFKLGVLQDYRLLCLFRFKIWWMIPRVGNSGSDIPVETQKLLLESKEDSSIDGDTDYVSTGSKFYVLFLPVLDGKFRSSLQGNLSNELEFCTESGDPAVETSQCFHSVFVNYGKNPFDLMKESIEILEKHKGTFTHRERKQMPGNLDWLGWCTWDAFYTEVSPQGIKNGLKSLSKGGTPARFLIIDDGWQDTVNEFQREGEPFIEGTQFAARLASIEENKKFRGTVNVAPDKTENHLKDFIITIKETFDLKYVYVWHALMGYWGGVDPNAPRMKKYNPKLLYPVQSPGNLGNVRDIAMESLEKYGVGTIDPTKILEFYDDLHSYLFSQNVDGVKVDVQNVLETLGTGFGGRVILARQFQQALEKSIAKNFHDNNLISCMGHSTDLIFSSKKSAIMRASEDYMPRNITSQTLHIASVAFNSIFLGEIVVPDWDMFYSQHYAAEFHAAARAVGGCGVYVSDKPSQHDFKILKKLVLPDGSVLRAKYPGRPTRDCLFIDPVMNGKSLLKIWNLNKFSGVLGIFNCQGAGTWSCLDGIENNSDPELSELYGSVSPVDIEYLEEVAGKKWTGDCALFSLNAGSLYRLPKTGSVDVSLKVLQCDIFTVSPITDYDGKVQFAPLGLVDMYNSGGAIEAMNFIVNDSDYQLMIKGRGPGRFGAYSSLRPKICTVNTKEEEFKYQSKDGFLTIPVPHGDDPSRSNFWDIAIVF